MKIFSNFFVATITTAFILSSTGLAIAATAVNLGTADNFAILAGSTITSTGATTVNGDLGLSPGGSVTGFGPGIVSGIQHIADAVALSAQNDLTTAYNAAAGQAPTLTGTELGGTTKTPGVYNSASGTFGITGTLTLDAQGDPNAVFVFQTASTLITAGSSNVVLTNSAQACNVYWQVGSSATLGISSTLKGNILASASVTLTTGATVSGRVLARSGAVTLDTNTVTKVTCATPPVVVIPPPTPVVITPPVVAPLISVTKVPTPLALTAGPGSVVYNYTVANIGTVTMSNVKVTDDKCSVVSFVSGDTNIDSKLDVSESWKYSCTTALSKTTTNTVTATGDANGLTATATANATVVVTSAPLPSTPVPTVKQTVKPTSTAVVAPTIYAPAPAVVTPKLPKTGIGPDEEYTPWNAAIPVGMFVVVATSLVVVLRKRMM